MYVADIDEMLMQSYTGRIDLFPGEVHGATTKHAFDEPVSAWFDLEFEQRTTISSFRACLAEPVRVHFSFPPFQFVVRGYHIGYWDSSQWLTIPGTKVEGTDEGVVEHRFDPAAASRIRMVITEPGSVVDGKGKQVTVTVPLCRSCRLIAKETCRIGHALCSGCLTEEESEQ